MKKLVAIVNTKYGFINLIGKGVKPLPQNFVSSFKEKMDRQSSNEVYYIKGE